MDIKSAQERARKIQNRLKEAESSASSSAPVVENTTISRTAKQSQTKQAENRIDRARQIQSGLAAKRAKDEGMSDSVNIGGITVGVDKALTSDIERVEDSSKIDRERLKKAASPQEADRAAQSLLQRQFYQEAPAKAMKKQQEDDVKFLRDTSTKKYDNNVGGQFGANFRTEEIGVRKNRTGYERMQYDSPHNDAYVSALDVVAQQFQRNNAETLEAAQNQKNPLIRSFVTDFAGGLPQQLFMLPAKAVGGIIGAGLGGYKGFKLGASIGTTGAMYQLEAGGTYNDLVAAGVDKKTAKALANDVGLLNSALEGVDEYVTLGIVETGNVASALGVPVKQISKKLMAAATKNMAGKVLSAAARYAMTGVTEYAEEYLQEVSGMAAEETGKIKDDDFWYKMGMPGMGELLSQYVVVLKQTLNPKTMEDYAKQDRARFAGRKGAVQGLWFGGVSTVRNNVLSKVINTVNDASVGKSLKGQGAYRVAEAISAGLYSNDENVRKIATKIQQAQESGSGVTDTQLGSLVRAMSESVQRQVQQAQANEKPVPFWKRTAETDTIEDFRNPELGVTEEELNDYYAQLSAAQYQQQKFLSDFVVYDLIQQGKDAEAGAFLLDGLDDKEKAEVIGELIAAREKFDENSAASIISRQLENKMKSGAEITNEDVAHLYAANVLAQVDARVDAAIKSAFALNEEETAIINEAKKQQSDEAPTEQPTAPAETPVSEPSAPTGADTVKEFAEKLGKAGKTVFPAMYNDGSDAVSYIGQMAKAYTTGQKGTVTPEEWERVTKPALVAEGGANAEQIQAAYIAGQADAELEKPAAQAHNEVESVEEAKSDLKKAIRVPIEGKNEEALAAGAESGDLSMDSIKITGNVPGFTDQQRFSLVEQIVEGSQTDAEQITADVPDDGTFTIPNTPGNVARVLDKLKVKAIQEATITKDIDEWMRGAQRAYVVTADGNPYLTDGILARKITPEAAEFSRSKEGYSAEQSDIAAEFIQHAMQEVLKSGSQITQQPVMGKSNGHTVYVFDTDNNRAVFDKKFFDRLPKDDAVYHKRVELNGQPVDIVVSVDKSGDVSGLLLGLDPKKTSNIDEETFRPASIKNVKAAPVSAQKPNPTPERKNAPVTTPEKENSPVSATPQQQIADAVKKHLESGSEFNSARLFEIADKAYGGTMAQGKYSVKDAYDSMELAVEQSRGATMPRPQDWTAKRIKDGKVTEARPLSELIAKMEHDFGLNVTFGHVRGRGVLGTFNPRDKGLRSKLENDLPTISHELGHWLDNRFSIRDTAIPDDVKKEFEAALGPGKSEYPNKKKWVTEGIAEFVRRYLQNRDTASIDFPEATKHFLGMMDAKTLALFQNFADEINAVYSLDADTASSSIVSKEKGAPDFRTPAEKAQDAYNRFRIDYIDTNDPIRILDRITGGNAYIYATNAAHSSEIAARLLKSDLVDLDGQYVGPGLKSALHGVNTRSKKEWQDFNEYLVVLHGPERLAAGKRVFSNDAKNNAAFMDRRRAALEKQYPAFRGAAARLIRFENDLVYTWGVKTGLISEDLFKTWKKLYPHHVPLNRVIAKGAFSTEQKRGFANQSNPLRRAKGSGLDIYNPVENIMDEVAMLVHAGLHNNVYRIVCDEAIDNNLEAVLMEKIATPMKPHKFDVTGLKEQIKNEVYEGTMRGDISDESAEGINKVLDNIADVMTQYERGKAGGDIVTVMRDGTPEFWKVNDPLLLEALTNMTAPKISGVMKIFAVTTRFLQSNITGRDVIWGIFSNAPRDIMTLMHYTQFKNKPLELFKAIGSTYVNAFREMYLDGKNVDPLYLEYLALGGKHAGKYTADTDFYKSARRSFTQTNTQRVLNIINPINAVGFVSDTIEMGPRFATYKLLRQQGVSPQKAFYEAMDITVNFYKSGRISRDISKFIPYFNANVQGTDKFVRYYTAEDAAGKENRKRVIWSRVLGLLASSLILGALGYIINNADEEKKKDYQQLSNYTKNSYFNIPTGNGKYFSIPKGRELDVGTSMVERTLETWLGENKHAFDEFYEYAVDNFLPGVASDVAEIPSEIAKKGVSEGLQNKALDAAGRLGLLGVVFNLGANRDFLGKPIESQHDKGLLPKDRYTQSSSKLAYWLGQAFGASPKKADYFGQQTLGFMWKYQKALFPVDASRRDATLGVKNRYVKDNVYSQDLVNWMYDKKDQSAKAHASDEKDADKAITAKTDNAMTTFYSRFNSLNRGNTSADSQRESRQTVLDMIDEYRKSTDAGNETRSQALVYDVVRKSSAGGTSKPLTELLPSTMQTYIKSGDTRYDLTDVEYVEYQTLYNGYYWSLAESSISSQMTDREKIATIRQIKELAKDKASEKILKRKGASYDKYSEKYPGVSDKDVVRFEAQRDLANDDGSFTRQEAIDILKQMVKDGLEKKDASTLYRSTGNWSDKNNPWKRYK